MLLAGFAGGADGGAALLGGDVGDLDGIGHGGFLAFVDGVGDLGQSAIGAGLDDGVGHDADDELDGGGGVVVRGKREVDGIRIIRGVADGEDRDVQLVGFEDGVALQGRVDQDDGVGEAAHFLDALKVLLQLGELFLEQGDFLLRKLLPGAVFGSGLEVAEPLDAALDGAEVGEGPAEPAVGDVEGAGADGLVDDDLLALGLGADEEDLSAAFDDCAKGLVGSGDALNGLVEVDDVDAIAGPVDEFAHLWVPTTGLMPEVDAGGQALLHRDDRGVGIMHHLDHDVFFGGQGGFLNRGLLDLFDFVTHFGDLHLFVPPPLPTDDHLLDF